MRVPVFVALVVLAACGPKRPHGPTATARVKLAVLPAESDRFPKAAKAATDSLTAVQLTGIDDKEVSAVSLEVVQLSIECVEATAACYEKVGTQLGANRILFAQIAPAAKKKVKVTVTLFDVDARSPRTAQRTFANEKDAQAHISDLVAEATR